MHLKPPFDQSRGEVVAVENWTLDDGFPVFPTGQKPKRALFCPAPAPHRFLISDHRYLLKEPMGYHSQQIWSEVFAYKLSRHLPVDVPPAFLAHDARQGRSGVLVEFFYGHIGQPEARLVHARDGFQARRMAFNAKSGSLHDNIALSRLHNVEETTRWWARTIAFDTLIGNTDRHSENWGFLVTRGKDGRPAYAMTPAFDNGSSLGWVTRDADIAATMREPRFARFIANGRHHFAWTAADDDAARGHAALAARFVSLRPDAGRSMEPFAILTDTTLDTVLQECVSFTDFAVAFTAQRAEFVRAQVIARRAALLQCLGG